MITVISVRRSSQLSAAPDEYVVRYGDGFSAVDGSLEAGRHVARLCASHSSLLRRLPLRTQHQGTPAKRFHTRVVEILVIRPKTKIGNTL